MDENEINQLNLPRLFELADMDDAFRGYLKDSDSPAHIPLNRNFLRDFEADLSTLDDKAWAFFKKKADSESRLKGGYPQKGLPRGWQPLHDLRNEAKGYGHLKSLGCEGVEFISTGKKGQTPDLKGTLGAQTVLCEVKTINVSDGDIRRSSDRSFQICFNERHDKLINARSCENEACASSGIIHYRSELSDQFLEKLKRALRFAACQIDSYENKYSLIDPRRMVYVVACLDGDVTSDQCGDFTNQINNYINMENIRHAFNIDIVIIFSFRL